MRLTAAGFRYTGAVVPVGSFVGVHPYRIIAGGIRHC